MKLFSKETRTEQVNLRTTPSRSKFLKDNKINKTKLFDEAVDKEMLRATSEPKFKSESKLEKK